MLELQKYLLYGKTPDDLKNEFGIMNFTHPTLPLIGFKYNQIDSAKYKFTSIVRECRGIVLERDSWNLVAKGFNRFFNLGESPEEDSKFDWNNFTVTEKVDGCFVYGTKLNLWNGNTLSIGEIVSKKLDVTLVGMDENGNIVPCKIKNWFNNGKKNNWLDIYSTAKLNPGGRGSYVALNRLRVTENHRIFINGEFQPVIKANINDTILSFEVKPSKSVLHLIESGLLGDGCITPCAGSFRYTEGHKEEHLYYVEEIKKWMGNSGGKIRDRISGYGSLMYDVSTKNYQYLKELRKKWYPDNIKIVPKDLSWMDNFSVAKWYMDDGSLVHSESQKDRATLSTHGFIKEDVERLCVKLNEMYGVDAVSNYGKGWYIRINSGYNEEIDRFWSSIAQHIIQIMRYKLPEKYRDIPYREYEIGYEEKYQKESIIIGIKKPDINLKNFPSGRSGFDIETTTNNYFAKGVLVHNSLILLYNYRKKWLVNTSGSFGLKECYESGLTWTELFWQNAGIRVSRLNAEYTYVFELCTKWNKVIRTYEENKVFLLSVFNGEKELPGGSIDFYSIPMQFYPKTREEIALQLKNKSEKDPTWEGLVLRDCNDYRLKVKTDTYLMLHHLKGEGFSDKRIISFILNGEIDEVLTYFPEFAVEIHNLTCWLQSEYEKLSLLWENSRGITSQKEFAQYILPRSPFSSILFNLRKNFGIFSEEWRKSELLILKVYGGYSLEKK